jgi:hypothetical protein
VKPGKEGINEVSKYRPISLLNIGGKVLEKLLIAQKSRTLIYMLSRTAKLHWGLGHKSLKTVYERALVPLMTYGAPVWEEVVTKQRSLHMMQTAQRLINIKISKAYRTISYEASCVMARVPPTGIVIMGKVQMYKRKHCLESSEHACDMPLPVNEWPHPARRVTITETSEQTTYPIDLHGWQQRRRQGRSSSSHILEQAAGDTM